MEMNYQDFCRQFYSVTAVPVTYINSNKEIFYMPLEDYKELDLFSSKFATRFHLRKNPDYYITQSFCYLGFIKSSCSENALIIGPVFSTPISDDTIQSFMHEFSISKKHHMQVTSLLSALPRISFSQFLNILSFVHLCLNRQTLDLVSHFEIIEKSVNKKVSKNHSQSLYTAKEEQTFHNSFQFEQQWLSYVQNGDVKGLKHLLTGASAVPLEGVVADNTLRQTKNIFIAAATLLTRSAITGGLDSEQAYYLSDNYIQEMESSSRIDEINALQYTMILDFTERVTHCKIPTGMSREIFSCIQYISQHTNESIQVDDVADFINMSRSTITRKFKAELGFDISSFIKRCKLEEAKSLLTFTDKSLSAISSYLCFSSQSHFQTSFKNRYGITPLQYRNQTMK